MADMLHITASYVFLPIQESALADLQQELTAFGLRHAMTGLVLIATEGVNGTVSGSKEAIEAWKTELEKRFGAMTFKDSEVDCPVFKRWSVKIKPEIVALKHNGISPQGKHRHLSPQEWHSMLQQEDVIVLDARNDYEADIGKFNGALGGATKSFHEFPDYVRDAALPKDKKILMYCTGGIRCEKALLEMESQGYDNVYQLDGGILAYLQQFPNEKFEGECFVFDHRVAVDQNLRASAKFDLCPHCGHAGDREIVCNCGKRQRVCTDCHTDEAKRTCSKRCANEVLADVII